MRRRNLIIASDSDEEDGDAATAVSASASVSVASGGGSICRPSSRSPSPFPAPYQIPSSPPPSPPIEISDYEEEVDEIQDPDGDSPFFDVPDGIQDSDGDSPFVDVSEDLSPPILPPSARTPTPTPPSAPASAPPVRTPTPFSAPAPAPTARTPAPTPLSAPVPTPARTSIPNPSSAPAPLFRVPTSTPPSARTPTPTPPSARTPTPTPPSAQTPTPTLSSVRTPTPTPRPISTPLSTLSRRLHPPDEFLRRLGLSVRPEWLESCAAGVPGFDGLGSTEAQARRCFEQFLFADMNACGAGALPEGVGRMNAAILEGPFVLQVDEIVNISAPLRERYREAHAGPKRCLKLSMTDGAQRLYGMEYRPIKDLAVLAPAGFKIVIRNVHIRRGLFMLVPEVIEILGGNVDELEAARDRLVSEVNKPPRGKRSVLHVSELSRILRTLHFIARKQGGLHLSSRATLAAWAGNISVTSGGEQGISMPRTVNPFHATGLGNASQAGRIVQPLVEEHVNPPVIVSDVQEQSRHFQDFTTRDLPTPVTMNNTEDPAPVTYQYDPAQSIDRTARTLVEEYADHPIVVNNVHEQILRVQEITMQDQPSATTSNREPSASTPCGYDSQQGPLGIGRTSTNAAEGARSSNVDDEIYQMEHPVILSGENEKPFTYIFSMLADWGMKQDTLPYIQGKIKGLITCVKHFNFKQCKEYDLYVYIDDGSYISEAYVDRDVVQSIIGHSSKEVSAALYSGDSASANAMKQTMSGFRRFLVNFEGTMLIEFNRKSSVPVVRAMNEGCLSSDAWLLLRRMKTFSAGRHLRSLDFMDTTP